MNNVIENRWLVEVNKSGEVFREYLEKYWSESYINKFFSISPNCNTAIGIMDQLYSKEYRQYTPYNEQFPMWEYLVLLKLVHMKYLDCKIAIKENNREVLVFKKIK